MLPLPIKVSWSWHREGGREGDGRGRREVLRYSLVSYYDNVIYKNKIFSLVFLLLFLILLMLYIFYIFYISYMMFYIYFALLKALPFLLLVGS